ncbi:DNA replication/repair protein RecF [Tumebacillus permanentifrigoris]|uniref:DNA replication and repair protein RecF n=1 Tax=Tumebacillus permanentifrigoris TaxID=378543 RepID=A0A316DF01_9BACL|nr:DNA replication/repair protein RecF [Tumebacillus permanentifrigoris]PWK16614.1 DNA replication and repair protein RecF [Tumebacillus permanentifrigoris]
MWLKALELRDFRNYESLQLFDLSPRVNIFVGQNAQGKTNVVESVLMLAVAKSHRTSRDAEVIRFEAETALVQGMVEREDRTLKLDLHMLAKGKKSRVNGVEKRKMSDFVGHLNVVLFAPEDLQLIKGGPQLRRRFLDVEIGQVSPQYLYNLSQYQKVLLQRNTLLKEISKKEKKEDLLAIWDEQLCVYGAKVVQKRYEFVEKLEHFARDIHSRISGGKELLSFRYVNSFDLLEGADVTERFFETLQSKRRQDILRGTTSVGPHRDDLEVRIDDREVHTYGSQGQQRTASLSMKLAEIELIRAEVGEYPVLLLDDVLSELDSERQLHLVESMGERVQTLITTTTTYGLEQFMQEQAHVYRVEHGVICREG